MKHKDEVLDVFITWKKDVKIQSGKKIKVLHSDNGGEYTSDHFLKFCKKEGIQYYFTIREIILHNRVIEIINQTLLEKIWCMLSNFGLAKHFWVEALTYATHLVNHLACAALEE